VKSLHIDAWFHFKNTSSGILLYVGGWIAPPFRKNVVPSSPAYSYPNKSLYVFLDRLYPLYERIMIIHNVESCLTDDARNMSEDSNF